MPYSVVLYATRKTGMTPAAFRKHYEEVHMPLIQELAGHLFPISHTRHYIDRFTPVNEASADVSNENFPASVILGAPTDFAYDAYVNVIFRDVAHFQEFFAHMQKPDIAARLRADEELFLDQPAMRAAMVNGVHTTKALGQ